MGCTSHATGTFVAAKTGYGTQHSGEGLPIDMGDHWALVSHILAWNVRIFPGDTFQRAKIWP